MQVCRRCTLIAISIELPTGPLYAAQRPLTLRKPQQGLQVVSTRASEDGEEEHPRAGKTAERPRGSKMPPRAGKGLKAKFREDNNNEGN